MPLSFCAADPRPLPPGTASTDAFHRQPLLAVRPTLTSTGAVRVVRSWPEAYALHGAATLKDLNPAYVAVLISGRQSAATAPYRRILRLPRAHQVQIGPDGRLNASPYDPLAHGSGPMRVDELHSVLRQGLLDHVQQALTGHNGPIGCEHSSGLDSNAVLGALVHGLTMPSERLHTWSDEDQQLGERVLLEQFRPFHGLLPSQCHRQPPRPDLEGGALADVLGWRQQLRIYGALPMIGGNPIAMATLAQQGCSILFSGLGGDQAISHHAANVPTDLVAQLRWPELVRWLGSRRRALKTGAERLLGLACRPWAVHQVMRHTRSFCRSDLLERSLTAEGRAWLGPELQRLDRYPWEWDGYVRLHTSIRRRVLADWVAVRLEEETRLAHAHGMAMAFPLLDERLIATLLQQDPACFSAGAGRGRLLHRLAFAPFLPPYLRDHPSKQREPECGREALQQHQAAEFRQLLAHSLRTAADWHPALLRCWDREAILRESEAVLEQADPPQHVLIGTALAVSKMPYLSCWFEALDG